MKKLIALLMVLALLPIVLNATAEETENSASGNWYTSLDNMTVILTLSSDGSYVFEVPAMPDMNQAGTWEYRNGFVFMDGDEAAPLSFNGPTLTNGDVGLFFTREQPQTYAPADPITDIPAGFYTGLWRTAYTMQDGVSISADFTNDDTLIYIEELKAVFKGGPFGYRIVDLAFENGAFTYAAEGLTARMELQQDGFLRLTTEKDGITETRILLRTALNEPEADE